MDQAEHGDRRSKLIALLVCALLGLVWGLGVQDEQSWGWDESMHAELPAARMLLSAQEGEWELTAHALHDCMQYPFGWPVVLAGVQAVTGLSEHACRVAGRFAWALGLYGLFLLVGEAARRLHLRRGAGLAPWLALAFAATSPLALSYSGTLFLEMPFVVVSIFALRAWLRRGEGRVQRRELAAGAWLAAAFFTKFNYGLLLGFGLFLALLVELALAVRAGALRPLLRRSALLALLPALAFLWWFVLPLPLGGEVAALHREALRDFLAGNTDESMATPWYYRPVDAATYLVWSPRVLLLLAVGALASLAQLARRPSWTLWIAGLACVLPVLLHPFHLNRFLLPGAVFLWCLAALGLAPLLPAGARARAGVLAALTLAVGVAPALDGWALLERVGVAKEESQREQLEGLLAGFRDLTPDRSLETNGLAASESQGLLELLAAEVRPDDRLGWVGVSTLFSPAALHVGLIARGTLGSEQLVAGALDESFIDMGQADPGWDRTRLGEWARGFSVIIATEPVDLSGPGKRDFMEAYRDQLAESEYFEVRGLGELTITRPSGAHTAEIYALRPTQ